MYTQIAPNPEMIHIWNTDLSDMYKDAYGVRPRHYKEWWTKDELEAEYKHLQRQIVFSMEEEKKAESEAFMRFEILIRRTIKYGAGDCKTAIRWLVDGEDLEWNEHDLKYFFWKHGLSYEIQNEWAKALVGNSINLPIDELELEDELELKELLLFDELKELLY
jgi:CRISPR/Cas system CMR-associated protein Cmr5 small subunit